MAWPRGSCNLFRTTVGLARNLFFFPANNNLRWLKLNATDLQLRKKNLLLRPPPTRSSFISPHWILRPPPNPIPLTSYWRSNGLRETIGPIGGSSTRFFANGPVPPSSVQPHMIYFQNPFVWLVNRWDFMMLRWHWDPAFSLNDFRRGCKQALCTITQCIAVENYSELHGLISAQTLEKLKEEVNSAWNLRRRKDVGLLPDQVHVVLPHKVYLQKVVENKYCDIDMILVAFKPRTPTRNEPHVGLLIEAAIRFHRNYTVGVLPDWTVTRLFLKSRDVHLEKSSLSN